MTAVHLCPIKRAMSIAVILLGSLLATIPTPDSWGQSQPTLRKEYVYLGGRLVAIEECGYSLPVTSSTLSSIASGYTFSVVAGPGCSWAAVSNDATGWLTTSSAD